MAACGRRRWLGAVAAGGALSACSWPFAGPRFEPSGLADQIVLSLVVDANDGLYAGTSTGIFRSSDAGRTWQPTAGLPGQTAVPALSAVAGRLYAGTGQGVYRSDDGLAWQALGGGLPTEAPVLSVAADPADRRRLLVGTGRRGVYRSDDEGQTWRRWVEGLAKPDTPVYTVAVDPTDPRFWLAGAVGLGIYRSTESGRSWQPLGSGLSPGASVFTILGSPDGWLMIGTSVGLFRSADRGQTWRWASEVLGRTRVIALIRDPFGPRRLLAGTDDGVFQSEDLGASWRLLAEGVPKGEHVSAVAVVRGRVIAGAGPAWALDRRQGG